MKVITNRTLAKSGLIALLLNLLLFVYIVRNNGSHFLVSELRRNPDATDYLTLGKNIALHRAFSRERQMPFSPDPLRTPLFPLAIAILGSWKHPWTIMAANVVAHVATCVAIYHLVRSWRSELEATIASLLVAVNITVAINNFLVMSEAIFIGLLSMSLAVLLPPLLGAATGGHNGRRIFIGGILLGLATLTRPTSLYLPVVLALVVFSTRGTPHGWKTRFRLVAAAVLGFAVLVLPWVVRNAAVFRVPRLTTVDSSNLVYFVGGGAFQVERSLSLDGARRAIAEEYGLPSYSEVQNPWSSTHTVREIDARLRRAAPKVILRYPRSLMLSSMLGLVKAVISHNVSVLARICGRQWANPGTRELIHLRRPALHRLLSNGPLLAGLCIYGSMITLLTTLGSLIGTVTLVADRRSRQYGICLASIAIYLCLTVMMFGFEANWRSALPLLPVSAALAGTGLVGACRSSWEILMNGFFAHQG